MSDFLYRLARPVLNVLDPERGQKIALGALKFGLAGVRHEADDPILRTTVWGLDFPNPVGLAAGFDKDAQVYEAALRLGFGFVEAGTVTPLPQPGNAGQRLYRLAEDGAVINRFGFNSRGISVFAKNLRHRKGVGIIGANVGKNRDTADAAADYVAGIEAVAGLADYLVINISSPNTPGLRGLQGRAQLEELLARVNAAPGRAIPANASARRPPLLVKAGPDLDEAALRDIAEVVLAAGVDGLIIGNTTVARPAGLKSRDRDAPGGLSGAPLFAPSTACLAAMYRFTGGKIPLIGCGGIASGADAYAKIRAGASLVQLYTALSFHGPSLIGRIKREIAELLRAEGFAGMREAVGTAQQ